MTILSRLLSALPLLAFCAALAQPAPPQPQPPPPEKPVATPADTTANLDTARTNILLNIDIFGQAAVGSYYILWDNVDLSTEMKTILTSRNFAKDEFFMQNIDREQFEQERVLQLFEDKKREYFKLFPDDEDEED